MILLKYRKEFCQNKGKNNIETTQPKSILLIFLKKENITSDLFPSIFYILNFSGGINGKECLGKRNGKQQQKQSNVVSPQIFFSSFSPSNQVLLESRLHCIFTFSTPQNCAGKLQTKGLILPLLPMVQCSGEKSADEGGGETAVQTSI